MRILVCVKHVPDTTEVRFDPATQELRVRQAPTKINNYDENAMEAAVVLRQALKAEVVVGCVGPSEAAKTVKEAVAMGADRGVLVTGPWVGELDAAGTASVIAGLARSEGPFDLVLAGDVSEDGYHSLVPGLVATALSVPFVRGVSALDSDSGGDLVSVERQVDGAVESYSVTLPAVLSVSTALNTPRTVTKLQVMKVPMSKVATRSAADVGVDEARLTPDAAATRLVGVRPAATPRSNEVVTGEPDDVVAQIIARLEQAGVLA
ncbi:MAG: electron transfer flavoprotein subunit beta/FixA family protein [Micrococcales bacterium]|nr:electron transfer flavoprotein subunit beta/FixA family protein [Micrococcales bacterium]